MADTKAIAKKDPIYELLAANKTAITRVIPAHVTPERLMRIAHSAITGGYRLADCTPASLVNGVIEISILGLEVGRTAYLVPFKNKHSGRYEAQVIIDYRGFIELAFRSGRVESFPFKPVYGTDEFMVSEGTQREIRHTVNISIRDRGPIVAAYAICNFKGGGYDFEVVGPADIEVVKRRSMGAKKADSPWTGDDEWTMWCKTAVRRLSKRIPQAPELVRSVQLDELNEAGIRQKLEHIQDLVDVTPKSTLSPGELYKATNGKQDGFEGHRSSPEGPPPGMTLGGHKKEDPPPAGGAPDPGQQPGIAVPDKDHPFFPERIKNMRKSKLNPDSEGYKGHLLKHAEAWPHTPDGWKMNAAKKWNNLQYNEPFPFQPKEPAGGSEPPPDPDPDPGGLAPGEARCPDCQAIYLEGENHECGGQSNNASILDGYPNVMPVTATGVDVMVLSGMCQKARSDHQEICALVIERTGISPDNVIAARQPIERWAMAWEFLSHFEAIAGEKGVDPFSIKDERTQGEF